MLATLAAYQPAWHGGILWDDDMHITPPAMRTVGGLARIWLTLGSTPQYYPVVHSVFWGMHQVFGDDTFGYHLTNIVLHASSAFLVAVILRRLKVRGAVLAAVIFALHPIHVESVAWITELKNTLSGVLYLSAGLTYLTFDASRRRSMYGLSLLLFVLALLSKSVTATLPVALLIVFWWQRGRLAWRDDIVPLLPFVGIGVSVGLTTAWVERAFIGAQGAEFQLSFVERCLMAGRAVVFYLYTLLWPSNLIFIYERWAVSQAVWWQYLYPLGIVVVLAALWLVRAWSRAPLAAMLFFCATLFPALGFFDVYPFRFSLVADHFAYLASIGVIALAAAGFVMVADGWQLRASGRRATIVAVGCVLAVLTWNQSGQYVNAETLYRTTLSRNPSCWLALSNLGDLELRSGDGRVSDAVAHFKEALRLKPDFAEAHYNLGVGLDRLGRVDEAIVEFQEGMRLNQKLADADAQNNLGRLLQRAGRPAEAEGHIREAIRLAPELAEVRLNLGNDLERLRRPDEAIAAYRDAVRLARTYAEARNNLAQALVERGRYGEAIPEFEEALRLNPQLDQVRSNLARALALSRNAR